MIRDCGQLMAFADLCENARFRGGEAEKKCDGVAGRGLRCCGYDVECRGGSLPNRAGSPLSLPERQNVDDGGFSIRAGRRNADPSLSEGDCICQGFLRGRRRQLDSPVSARYWIAAREHRMRGLIGLNYRQRFVDQQRTGGQRVDRGLKRRDCDCPHGKYVTDCHRATEMGRNEAKRFNLMLTALVLIAILFQVLSGYVETGGLS